MYETQKRLIETYQEEIVQPFAIKAEPTGAEWDPAEMEIQLMPAEGVAGLTLYGRLKIDDEYVREGIEGKELGVERVLVQMGDYDFADVLTLEASSTPKPEDEQFEFQVE